MFQSKAIKIIIDIIDKTN